MVAGRGFKVALDGDIFLCSSLTEQPLQNQKQTYKPVPEGTN